jgi:hypothetical protein
MPSSSHLTYKNYLFVFDDCYNLKLVKRYLPKSIYKQVKHLFGLNTKGITLNDSYNKNVAKYGKLAVVPNLCKPTTLFTPYCLTNDPAPAPEHPIGFPIPDNKLQKRGYNAVNSSQPSCMSFCRNGIIRKSPYTSHCSAYVSWATFYGFGVSLVPTQVGDFCHVAAEMYDVMVAMTDYWEKVDAVHAQKSANEGKLAIAVKKIDDPDREGYLQNGHIAIVLPITWEMGMHLQKHKNYPKEPAIIDENSFDEFIAIWGPEIIQAGSLNFQHTVCANGFANYYPKESKPPDLNIDAVVDFFVYKHYTQQIQQHE